MCDVVWSVLNPNFTHKMGLNQLNSSNDIKPLFIMLIGAWNIYMYETIDNLG